MKNDMSSNAKLSFLERFGYGVGDYAANLVYSAISAFLLVYYTNVIGASAAAAASVIAVSKIFDGVSDLIMGYIVDHTDTKYGKARPWIARLCVPLAVCTVLMFSVPASFAGKAQIAYMFLTYNLVSTIFYTGVNVPYATLQGLMTTNQYERGLLGNFRNLLSTAGTMTINTVVLKMTEFFGGGDLDKHYDKKDFKNWELYTHVLTDDTETDLKKLPSAKGIWAPCLTYCGDEDLFYVIYGVMNSMNARYFDVDNYLITAKDIKGPWSEPVYIHSSGFDASILHDDDGRKYIVSLEWETREGYEKPGSICMVEYSPKDKEIVGYPRHIWSGGTDRGCIEAPHLTKHGGFYYIMCAEGGTGYNHCVTMGRSANVWGPYEKDPSNPIVTSAPGESFERHDPDHLKLKYFNPESPLQKCGHGSYVETQLGEVYLLHLCARPFVPELRCTLGRETAIQKMEWTLHQSQKIPERNTRTERPVHYPSGKRTETRTFEYKNPGGRRARLSPLKCRRAALLVRMEL